MSVTFFRGMWFISKNSNQNEIFQNQDKKPKKFNRSSASPNVRQKLETLKVIFLLADVCARLKAKEKESGGYR